MQNSKLFYSILIFSLCLSCVNHEIGGKGNKSDKSKNNDDLYLDSLKSVSFDTTSFSGKVQKIVNDFNVRHFPLIQTSEYELLDINFDNQKDLLIYYFGFGSGLRKKCEVYQFNTEENNFIPTPNLSNLDNPSFFLIDSLITGFYIGHGSGDAISLKWNKNQWDTSYQLKFIPGSKEDNIGWEVLKIVSEDTLHSYEDLFVIPPNRILRNVYE